MQSDLCTNVTKLYFSTDFSKKKITNTDFNENPSTVSSVDPCKQKERQTSMTKLTPTLTFRNLVKRLKPAATVRQRTNA